MTTINDISDLARILTEQPEWASTLRSLLLTESLLNLPAQFAEFVQETRENNRVANERLTRLEELVRSQGEQLRQLQELVRSQGEQLRQLQELVRSQGEQLGLMREALSELTARHNSLEGRLANYEGAIYERQVRNRALARSRNYLGLTEPYLALVQDAQSAPELNRAIQQALDGRVISPDESEDLQNADIIISGRNARHVVVETSLSTAENDIVRARRRADILAAITGDPVTPVVITGYLNELEKARAVNAGVTVYIIPFP